MCTNAAKMYNLGISGRRVNSESSNKIKTTDRKKTEIIIKKNKNLQQNQQMCTNEFSPYWNDIFCRLFSESWDLQDTRTNLYKPTENCITQDQSHNTLRT